MRKIWNKGHRIRASDKYLVYHFSIETLLFVFLVVFLLLNMKQLMRLLKEDKLGARSIDTIKPSDAKEWALRMKENGFSYNTINNHKRSLKASFYIAIQDDCVRKNPFDFKLSEVLENDTKEKVALTEEQEQALLSFIKTDNVYHKYYDDVVLE